MTDGMKWFLVIIFGLSFSIFFVAFTIQTFYAGGSSFKTPEQERAELYKDCMWKATQYTSGGEERVLAISQCGRFFGEN